jgi:hypothetical protein
MKIDKIFLLLAALLVCWAPVQVSADEAADQLEPSKPIKVTGADVYLRNISKTAQLQVEGKSDTVSLDSSTGSTRLGPESIVRITDGKAVVTAGRLRVYLVKGDRLRVIKDRKVVRPMVSVPEGYHRLVTVRAGLRVQKVKPSKTLFAP